jgi:hypothetical protein
LYCIPQRVFLSKQTHYQLKTKKFVYRNLHGIYITGAEVAKKKFPHTSGKMLRLYQIRLQTREQKLAGHISRR